MQYASRIKPISFLKANAAEVLNDLTEVREPMVITQNGEARAVIQDIASWEKTQETLALLKMLALGEREIDMARVTPVELVVTSLRGRRKPRA